MAPIFVYARYVDIDPFQHGTSVGHASNFGMVKYLKENPLPPSPNTIEVAEKVHELRLRGQSYAAIARRMQMSVGSAVRAHKVHLTQLAELDRLGASSMSHRVQDDRYETLLSSIWEQAMTGDLAAVRECRAILDSISSREMKVTAMIQDNADGETRRTLIAEGSTQEYIDALREMSK